MLRVIFVLGFALVAKDLPAQQRSGVIERLPIDVATLSQVASGDVDGAAAVIGARNTAAKGSVSWYQQTAIRLMQQAYICQATLDYEGEKKAATAAIKVLERGLVAQVKEVRKAELTQTYLQLAQVHEDFLHDTVATRIYYEMALAESPENPMARKAVERINAEDVKLERQMGGGK